LTERLNSVQIIVIHVEEMTEAYIIPFEKILHLCTVDNIFFKTNNSTIIALLAFIQ